MMSHIPIIHQKRKRRKISKMNVPQRAHILRKKQPTLMYVDRKHKDLNVLKGYGMAEVKKNYSKKKRKLGCVVETGISLPQAFVLVIVESNLVCVLHRAHGPTVYQKECLI